jgi:hypothetical protein
LTHYVTVTILPQCCPSAAACLLYLMMIRCPGCGGRNPRDAVSCEWCRRSFVQVHKRGLSARWWGALAAAVAAVLMLLVLSLVALNAVRNATSGTGVAATPSPLPLLPLPVVSPSPTVSRSPTAAPSPPPATAPPAPTATPAPRQARVANTSGLGANLRREPATTAPQVSVIPENAVVRILGPEERGPDGRLWRQIEDPRGNQGWIPADFLVELPT